MTLALPAPVRGQGDPAEPRPPDGASGAPAEGGEGAEGRRYDLRPRYAAGERWETEASLALLLRVRLVARSVGIDNSSEQEQRIVRRARHRVVAAEEGVPQAVRRRYLEAIVGTRDPGAPRLTRSLHPLHQRRLVLRRDGDDLEARPPAGDPPIPAEAVADEVLTERYEAALPRQPVAAGASWRIEGERLRRALGSGLGEAAEGAMVCRLEGVRRLALGEEDDPERYALVALTLEAAGRQGEADDAPRLETRLRGRLYFSLAHRKIAAVRLSGTARLRQTRAEGGHVVEVEGRGPVELRKRAWFPARPRRRD